jgi:hypothetical protein
MAMIGFRCGSGAATRRMPPDAGSCGIALDGHVAARRARPESHTGEPPARPLARPPLIRPDQGGCGDTVPALGSDRERSLSAVLAPVREGRGWG